MNSFDILSFMMSANPLEKHIVTAGKILDTVFFSNTLMEELTTGEESELLKDPEVCRITDSEMKTLMIQTCENMEKALINLDSAKSEANCFSFLGTYACEKGLDKAVLSKIMSGLGQEYLKKLPMMTVREQSNYIVCNSIRNNSPLECFHTGNKFPKAFLGSEPKLSRFTHIEIENMRIEMSKNLASMLLIRYFVFSVDKKLWYLLASNSNMCNHRDKSFFL